MSIKPKFAIKLDASNYIIDVQYFNEVPIDWIEISEFQYVTIIYGRKPYSKWINGKLEFDQDDEDKYLLEKQIYELREKMKDLQAEITLSEELLEDVTALEAEFSATKTLYDNLVNPPE